jgi:hypothetical protein
MERVDDLVTKHGLHPTLMKVDVEGSEFAVFEGSRDTLSTFRPVVISELWRKSDRLGGHTGAEVITLFEKLDYVVRDPYRLAAPDKATGEILCIPREKFDANALR